MKVKLRSENDLYHSLMEVTKYSFRVQAIRHMARRYVGTVDIARPELHGCLVWDSVSLEVAIIYVVIWLSWPGMTARNQIHTHTHTRAHNICQQRIFECFFSRHYM